MYKPDFMEGNNMNSRQQKKLEAKTTKKATEVKADNVKVSAESATAAKDVAVTKTETATEAKTEAAKTVAKKETKTAATKTVKKTASTEAEVSTAGKKETKTAEKKETAKSPKKSLTPEIFIQYGGNEADIENIIELAKQEYIADGHRASSIKDLKLYLKPEDMAAYYVINSKFAGKINLF